MPSTAEVVTPERKDRKLDLSRRGYSQIMIGNTVVFVRPMSAEVLRTGRIINGELVIGERTLQCSDLKRKD